MAFDTWKASDCWSELTYLTHIYLYKTLNQHIDCAMNCLMSAQSNQNQIADGHGIVKLDEDQ